MSWYSAGPQANPAVDTVLATTSPVSDLGADYVMVVIAASAAAQVMMEWLDDVDAVVKSQTLNVPASGTFAETFPYPLSNALHDLRLRLINGVPGGVVHGSMFVYSAT